jgi:predicted nucleotidyltransferase
MKQNRKSILGVLAVMLLFAGIAIAAQYTLSTQFLPPAIPAAETTNVNSYVFTATKYEDVAYEIVGKISDAGTDNTVVTFAKSIDGTNYETSPSTTATIANTGTPSIRERLEKLRPAVLEVAQRYGASNLRVFGSVALNQEHADSDLDLLVDLPASQSLLALVGIAQELEQLLGCPVDVAEPDSLHPLIRSEILQQAVGL